LNSVAIS
jgi:hypothetical protein